MGAVAEDDMRAPSHAMRYVVVAGAALALGAAFWAFNSYSNKKDEVTLQQFDAFRSAYAQKCNVPAYAAPAEGGMRDAYLTSPPVQVAVDKELAALKGGASCEEVVQALKKVGFTVPTS